MRYEITIEVDDLGLINEPNPDFDPVDVVVAAKENTEAQGGELTQARINGRPLDITTLDGES